MSQRRPAGKDALRAGATFPPFLGRPVPGTASGERAQGVPARLLAAAVAGSAAVPRRPVLVVVHQIFTTPRGSSATGCSRRTAAGAVRGRGGRRDSDHEERGGTDEVGHPEAEAVEVEVVRGHS